MNRQRGATDINPDCENCLGSGTEPESGDTSPCVVCFPEARQRWLVYCCHDPACRGYEIGHATLQESCRFCGSPLTDEKGNVMSLLKTKPAEVVEMATAAVIRQTSDAVLNGPAIAQRWKDVDEAHKDQCPQTPPGWVCTRTPGHDGPCAARERDLWQLSLSDAVDTARIDGPYLSDEQKALARTYLRQIQEALQLG